MTDDNISDPKTLAEAARASPKSVFDTPEEVIEESRLTRAQKRDVLDQWQSDAEAEQTATDEGMPAAPAAEEDELEKVNAAKTEVDPTGAATHTEK